MKNNEYQIHKDWNGKEMKECKCKRRVIVICGVFIFEGIMLTIAVLGVLFFIPPWQSKPFAVDSRVILLGGLFVYLSASVYVIYKVRQIISRYILFDKENVIFVLSKNERYECKWTELQPGYIDMRWKPAWLRRDFLHITFLKKQETVFKTMRVSENVKTKKESTFLLPSDYKGFVEFIGYLHENGVLQRFDME